MESFRQYHISSNNTSIISIFTPNIIENNKYFMENEDDYCICDDDDVYLLLFQTDIKLYIQVYNTRPIQLKEALQSTQHATRNINHVKDKFQHIFKGMRF